MTDAALFDWDGTLLDSRAVLLRAWHAATLDTLGSRFPDSAADEELVFTRPGSELFPRVAGGDLHLSRRLVAAFQAAYAEHADGVRAFPGVPEALAALRDRGVAIAVVTSKARSRYRRDVATAGFTGLIDVAVCVEDTQRHKPDPAPVRHALAALGVEPSRAVMVGDTPVDVAAGAAAGTAVVGVAWGASPAEPLLEAGATQVASDPGDLVRLVLHRDEETVTT